MITDHFLMRWLLGYEVQRKRMLKKAPQGPLREFLSVPFPQQEASFAQTPLLAVDFETTGLDALQDKLLSIGCVEVEHQQIKLGSCYHQIINTKGRLKADNVAIHQIMDNEKDQGKPLTHVIEKLLQRLSGKVMVVHFARIERQFLQQACLELYGLSPPLPIIDTLVVEKKRLDKKDIAYDPSTLRLSALREKYNLPAHYAHNALNDAIATAELLLAQINERERIPLLNNLLL